MPNTKKSNFVKRYVDGIKYAIKSKKYIKHYALTSDVIFIQSSPTALFNIAVVKMIIKSKKKMFIMYKICFQEAVLLVV